MTDQPESHTLALLRDIRDTLARLETRIGDIRTKMERQHLRLVNDIAGLGRRNLPKT